MILKSMQLKIYLAHQYDSQESQAYLLHLSMIAGEQFWHFLSPFTRIFDCSSMASLASLFIAMFFFQSFLGGIDDLQVIQSLVIKSYFMVATWDIVGRSPAPASHFAFFNF